MPPQDSQPSATNTYSPNVSYSSPIQKMPEIVEWILASPSIPMQLRQQFYVMWETAPLGNYEGNDMAILMAKFDEWVNHVMQAIPDKLWGKIQVFKDIEEGKEEIQMDISVMMNMLWQLYYIQLTRGRDAETLKAIRSQWIHSDQKQELIETQKKRGIRLF